jgi:hypothetical protein
MNDYPFGHPAGPEWEGEPPAPLCPYCGQYHTPGVCPHDDGPSHLPGAEPEPWDPGPEPPEVAHPENALFPLWMLGLPPVLDDAPGFSYKSVSKRSLN